MKQTKRKGKRVLSILLALALVISGWIPDAGAEQVEAADYGISNPVVADGVTTWDTIYFGNYYQSSSKKKDPIRWRVLHVDGDEAFLLADKNLDCQPYHKGVEKTDEDEDEDTSIDYSCTWETCTLRTWLNQDFLNEAFSGEEQSLIQTSTVVNEDNPYFKIEGGNNTQDKIFLLSIAEASNPAYGFNSEYNTGSETRIGVNTEYAKVRGAYTCYESPEIGNGQWRLRSPGSGSNNAAVVITNGRGAGNDVFEDDVAVRPALRVNLSASSSWTKGEKITADWGEVSENHTPDPTPASNQYGISNPVLADGVTTWDTIYFGNYYQSSSTKKEPIRWRVLYVDCDEAFLLADKNLDCQPYNEKHTDVTWETCTLRKWLNQDFLNEAFSGEEQSLIQTSTVVNDDNPEYETEGGNNTQDKIFLLSIAEASNSVYGFIYVFNAKLETRYGANTEYAKERGAYTSDASPTTGNGYWWLRSPGHYSDYASKVDFDGEGSEKGSYVNYDFAVRPALYVNLSSTSSWTKGEKVTANWGKGSGNHTPDPIPTPAPNPNNGKENGNGTNKSAADTSANTTTTTTGHSTYKVSGNAATVTAADKKAKSVTIKDTVTIGGKTYKVTSVAAGAFQNCTKLTKVTIGKNVTTIGKNAFKGCKKLKSITIKGAVKKIAKGAFSGIKKKAVFKVKAGKKQFNKIKKLIKKSGAKKPKIKKA